MATATVERTAPMDTTPGPIMSHRQIMFVMYGLMAGMFLSALDQTIVGTAIRTIGDDLHGLDQQAWVTTAYLIAATVTTPLYGKLSDIFGRRPLFITSISIFVLGSFLSSFATSMLGLAAFRAFQGLVREWMVTAGGYAQAGVSGGAGDVVSVVQAAGARVTW